MRLKKAHPKIIIKYPYRDASIDDGGPDHSKNDAIARIDVVAGTTCSIGGSLGMNEMRHFNVRGRSKTRSDEAAEQSGSLST
jgi:hypothetical protein